MTRMRARWLVAWLAIALARTVLAGLGASWRLRERVIWYLRDYSRISDSGG